MAITKSKLSINDISIGMKVTADQLSEMLDTYIILTDVHLIKDSLGIGTFEGIIDKISQHEIRITKPHSTIIYNDSYDREDFCEYEWCNNRDSQKRIIPFPYRIKYVQYIQDATFDTGYSHSLISAKSLDIGDRWSIEELRRDAIYDMNVKLSIGRGVESKDIDSRFVWRILFYLNYWLPYAEAIDFKCKEKYTNL